MARNLHFNTFTCSCVYTVVRASTNGVMAAVNVANRTAAASGRRTIGNPGMQHVEHDSVIWTADVRVTDWHCRELYFFTR